MKKDLLLGLGIGFFGGVLVGELTALLLAPSRARKCAGRCVIARRLRGTT